jgi:hypothetical protein
LFGHDVSFSEMGPRPAAKLTGHGLWNSDIATKVPLVAGLP